MSKGCLGLGLGSALGLALGLGLGIISNALNTHHTGMCMEGAFRMMGIVGCGVFGIPIGGLLGVIAGELLGNENFIRKLSRLINTVN